MPALPDKTPFTDALEPVQAILDDALLRSDRLTQDVMQHLTHAKGKGFRARLLLAAAADDEGNVAPDALRAAAAVELLHLATLVHDDVLDDAETRRGQESVQKRFGRKSAVICGDYLLCRSFLLVPGLSAQFEGKFSEIAGVTSRICLGELRQYRHNGDVMLGVRDYFRIIAGKTAALFAFALYAGGIVGGREEAEARRFARFGYYIGMAFQLTDDCLDYASDSATTGKNVHRDAAEGVITLPLIYSFLQKPALRDAVRALGARPQDAAALATEVTSLGGVEKTRDVAGKYYGKARKLLRTIQSARQRELLGEILRALRERRY